MKDFLLKHPFWAYCMLSCVCVTVENVVLGTRKQNVFDNVTDIAIAETKKLKDRFDKKEPMGFHFNKEEA